ncbi:MAG: hypothetical protein HY961_14480 [Ignavibacteriae bacterium]|nr:hypothetical protein [Ignavibacteriota bacterium]
MSFVLRKSVAEDRPGKWRGILAALAVTVVGMIILLAIFVYISLTVG